MEGLLSTGPTPSSLVDRTALAKPGLTNIKKKISLSSFTLVMFQSWHAPVMDKVGHLQPIYLSVLLESFRLLGLTNCVMQNTLKTKSIIYLGTGYGNTHNRFTHVFTRYLIHPLT